MKKRVLSQRFDVGLEGIVEYVGGKDGMFLLTKGENTRYVRVFTF